MKPLDAPETIETAFQCSEDVFDLKIRGDSILCGLRNGTVELFHVRTLTRELTLTDQEGSVQASILLYSLAFGWTQENHQLLRLSNRWMRMMMLWLECLAIQLSVCGTDNREP